MTRTKVSHNQQNLYITSMRNAVMYRPKTLQCNIYKPESELIFMGTCCAGLCIEIAQECVYNQSASPVTFGDTDGRIMFDIEEAHMADSSAIAVFETARRRGQRSLSEHDSKKVLALYGIPVVREILAETTEDAETAATELGYPVAVKACGAGLMHKSDLDLVALNVSDASRVRAVASEMLAKTDKGTVEGILVQPMVHGKREIIVGGLRDKQFGPCVMLGLGSIFVEAIADVAFRLAPLDARDASEMMRELQGYRIFEAFRGEPPIDEPALCEILIATGRLLIEHPDVHEVDINPLVFEGARPVAVDALITFETTPDESSANGGKG